MGYSTFKLLERGIPSSDLLKRVVQYSTRSSGDNLAELLLSYGFKKPHKKERFWALRHFFKPWQVNPRKLMPLYDLARQQGMMLPKQENPVTIDSSKIPTDFIEGFRDKDCASLDCSVCGYCEDIAKAAVSVKPEFREQSLKQFSEMDETMASGDLWGV